MNSFEIFFFDFKLKFYIIYLIQINLIIIFKLIKSKIVDVRPAIINAMGGQYKGMGLSKVADELGNTQ